MLRHGSGCHFGSFWQLRLSSVSLLVGSVAVLRGRDCTTSSYRIRARRRLFAETEPNRELRGKLAGLKVSLSSGNAKKFNVFKFRRDFRWFSWNLLGFPQVFSKMRKNAATSRNFSISIWCYHDCTGVSFSFRFKFRCFLILESIFT